MAGLEQGSALWEAPGSGFGDLRGMGVSGTATKAGLERVKKTKHSEI